jgi:eukaryotic-like serine/threonine-protein kinase
VDLKSSLIDRKLCLACNRQYVTDLSHCPDDDTQLVNLGRDETQQWIGKIVNEKYEIIEPVGKGGLGTVFKVRQIRLDRTVALKMFKDGITNDTDAKRFEQAGIAAKGRPKHPNLVEVYDYGVIDGNRPYLVMEFITGESLGSLIRSHGALAPERCLHILSQAMDGLAAAHASGMVHRDIKPSNIIIAQTLNGTTVKVVDFPVAGVYRHIKQDEALDLEREFSSPIYMSPEQCQGKRLWITSDVYSLAITLYEALTGRVPFKGRNVVETASMHISCQPPAFRHVRPDLRLSKELQQVVFRALEKDPSKRFQSMSEFKTALAESISDHDANDGYLSEIEEPDLPSIPAGQVETIGSPKAIAKTEPPTKRGTKLIITLLVLCACAAVAILSQLNLH